VSTTQRVLLRRTYRGVAGVALTAALALSVTACGTSTEASDQTEEEQTTVSTSGFLITAADLPEGWRDSNSQGVDYRVTVCGVDIEPQPPARATSIRFSQGSVGPFLEQHVRVYDDDVASGVITGLREALPGCGSYEATGSAEGSPTAAFTVEPLIVDGAPEDSVAWRQTSQGDVPITSDQLLVRRGDVAILFVSYALKAIPEPSALEHAARALPAGD
jgi:hypothetical protein